MEDSRNKELIRFTLGAILSSVMKSRAILLCPALDVSHPRVQRLRGVSHLAVLPVVRLAVTVWPGDPYVTERRPKAQEW